MYDCLREMLGRLDPQTVGRENDRFLQEIFSIFCCDSHHEASQQNSFYSRPLKITGTSVSSQKENKERWGIILNHFLSTNHPMLAANQRKKEVWLPQIHPYHRTTSLPIYLWRSCSIFIVLVVDITRACCPTINKPPYSAIYAYNMLYECPPTVGRKVV